MTTLYSGSDGYRLREALRSAISEWRTTHPHGIVRILDGSDEADQTTLHHLCAYASFMPQDTLAVIRTPESIPDHPDHVTLLVWQDGKPKAALTKHVDSMQSFDPLTALETRQWVMATCTARGTNIQPDALSALMQRTAGESWMLANELEKLCAYSGSAPITLDAVNALVPTRQEQDEWRLSNALAAGNKRVTIATLWERITSGAPMPLLVGSVAHATRTLLTRGSRTYTQSQLVRAHRALAELDRDSKSGLADAEDGLFSILLAL